MLEDVNWTPVRANAWAAGMEYVLPYPPMMERRPIVIQSQTLSPPAICVPATLPTLNQLNSGGFTPNNPRQNELNVGTPL